MPENVFRVSSISTTVEPRLSGLFDYPDFFLWSQFFHEYELVVILKTQSRKKPSNPFKNPLRFSKFASATRQRDYLIGSIVLLPREFHA